MVLTGEITRGAARIVLLGGKNSLEGATVSDAQYCTRNRTPPSTETSKTHSLYHPIWKIVTKVLAKNIYNSTALYIIYTL